MTVAAITTGFGITITYPDTGFEAYVLDVTPPEVTQDEIDVTHMESSGGYREFIGGLLDSGKLQLTVGFDPAQTMPVGETGSTVITFPSGTTWTFQGLWTQYGPKTPMDDKMTADVGIKASGVITIG